LLEPHESDERVYKKASAGKQQQFLPVLMFTYTLLRSELHEVNKLRKPRQEKKKNVQWAVKR
jgi:hypothetical protein